MQLQRRALLSTIAATLAAAAALPSAIQGQRHEPVSPPFPNPAGTAGPDDVPLPPRATDPKVLLKEDQKELRRDVDRLLQMAKDLKDESDKTPETDVLSLSLVKKVEDIEKLAHQIKDLIRAS
jgi:cytochrome P450